MTWARAERDSETAAPAQLMRCAARLLADPPTAPGPGSAPGAPDGGQLGEHLHRSFLRALPALAAEGPEAFLTSFVAINRPHAASAPSHSLSRALDHVFEASVDRLSSFQLSGWQRPWWQLFEQLRSALLMVGDPSDAELAELFSGFCDEQLPPLLAELPFAVLALLRGAGGEWRSVAMLDLRHGAGGSRPVSRGGAAGTLPRSAATVDCNVPGHADLRISALLGEPPRPDSRSLVTTCLQALTSMLGLYLSKTRLEKGVAPPAPLAPAARPETIETLAATLRQWAGFQRCALFSFEAGSGLVEGLVGNGVSSAQIRAIREPLARMPLFERALGEAQPSHAPDTATSGAVPVAYVRRFGLTSLLILPIRAGPSTIGFAALDQAGVPFARIHRHQLAEYAREIGGALQGELGNYGRTGLGRAAKAATMLSHREMAVLQYVAEGRTMNEAGAEMFLSSYTVRDYLLSAMHKLGAGNRVEAVVRANKLGLVV